MSPYLKQLLLRSSLEQWLISKIRINKHCAKMLKLFICSKLRLGCTSHFNLEVMWLSWWFLPSEILTEQIVVRSGSNHDGNNTFPRLFPVICWPVYWKCIGHFARKWISCQENGPRCEDHWTNLSQSDQCTVAYFLLIDRWTSRCCVAALYWIGLNGRPAIPREREKQLFGSLIFLLMFDTENCLIVLFVSHL